MLNTPPSQQVEQSSEPVESSSDDIALSNLDVEMPPMPTFGNSTSMIPPSMENQVIIMLNFHH